MVNVILIFDIGRTNKKFILYDRNYKVVEEKSVVIPDVKDEDGYRCEDLESVTQWLRISISNTLNKDYGIKAINFSTHGASFVHLDSAGKPVTPLYDYLKPVDQSIHDEFYCQFGDERKFSTITGSPALDMLNSGVQLFWLKKNKPEIFKNIRISLHLPQYANFIFSGKKHADITSIGCHTGLWDFKKRQYHHWLKEQDLNHLLPLPENPENFDEVKFGDKTIPVGIGMHDNSAALLSFEYSSTEPFVLLSSGTWNITMNPYLKRELNKENFRKDCLYYLLKLDKKVAASRLFLGNEYQYQVERLSKKFGKSADYHTSVKADEKLFRKVIDSQSASSFFSPVTMKGTGPYPDLVSTENKLDCFSSFEEAYHKLMLDLVCLQKKSIMQVSGDIKRLYVSGGFVKNKIFMELLCAFLPDWQIFIAENPRASALGAALAMHQVWNNTPIHETINPPALYKPAEKIDVNDYKFLLGD